MWGPPGGQGGYEPRIQVIVKMQKNGGLAGGYGRGMGMGVGLVAVKG